MFNLSGSEIVIIMLLALVILGPEKLPDAMRKAGKAWGELRKMSSSFQDEVRKGFDEPTREIRDTAAAVKKAATFDVSPTKGAVKRLLDPPASGTVSKPAASESVQDDDPPQSAVAEDDPVASDESSAAAEEKPSREPAPDDPPAERRADDGAEVDTTP